MEPVRAWALVSGVASAIYLGWDLEQVAYPLLGLYFLL